MRPRSTPQTCKAYFDNNDFKKPQQYFINIDDEISDEDLKKYLQVDNHYKPSLVDKIMMRDYRNLSINMLDSNINYLLDHRQIAVDDNYYFIEKLSPISGRLMHVFFDKEKSTWRGLVLCDKEYPTGLYSEQYFGKDKCINIPIKRYTVDHLYLSSKADQAVYNIIYENARKSSLGF